MECSFYMPHDKACCKTNVTGYLCQFSSCFSLHVRVRRRDQDAGDEDLLTSPPSRRAGEGSPATSVIGAEALKLTIVIADNSVHTG